MSNSDILFRISFVVVVVVVFVVELEWWFVTSLFRLFALLLLPLPLLDFRCSGWFCEEAFKLKLLWILFIPGDGLILVVVVVVVVVVFTFHARYIIFIYLLYVYVLRNNNNNNHKKEFFNIK
jgi:hypothetical protein